MTGMEISLYGVRGSTPVSSRKQMKYGGNTSCIRVRTDEGEYLFDAGTGMRQAGEDLFQEEKRDVHVFLSHYHWDHVLGLPFFGPLYNPLSKVSMYGAFHTLSQAQQSNRRVSHKERACNHTKESIAGVFDKERRHFPIDIGMLAADVSFTDLADEESFHAALDGLLVTHLAHAAHPGGGSLYRVTQQQMQGDTASSKTIIYTGDYESDASFDERFGAEDKRLIQLAQNADILIMDGQYTRKEYENKKGWGHSHMEKVCEIAAAANVKRLLITHHDPSHTDDFLDAIELEMKDYMTFFLGRDILVEFAREGEKIVLG